MTGPTRDERVGAVFQALADPTRREVVSLLSRSGSVTATELATQLPVSRQAVAKHLATLADAGLVSSAREGREVRYRLTPSPMNDTMSWMTTVGAEWDERLDALQRHLRSSG
ncbi:MAG TPA: metalloregulator ArsR/SmtB family transcription factor [Actinomycetota bacterium]|nr:metalloregulator ArsR/SmtB family transcription factor [Actinomycetota bacterium]